MYTLEECGFVKQNGKAASDVTMLSQGRCNKEPIKQWICCFPFDTPSLHIQNPVSSMPEISFTSNTSCKRLIGAPD